MARIRKAEEPQFTPGTPEFTMAQEQRRQTRQEEEELKEMYQTLLDLSISSDIPCDSLPSTKPQFLLVISYLLSFSPFKLAAIIS